MSKFIVFLCLISQISIAQEITKHVVYFETDQYEVPETEINRLLLFTQNLDTKFVKKVEIYGFCDDRGTDQYNLILSQNRANAIKQILTGLDVDEKLITNVDGKGEILLKIIETKDVNIIRGLNRKVEIDIIYDSNTNISSKSKPVDNRKKPLNLNSDLRVGDKVILDKILFRTGYSYVLKESIPVLEKMAKTLKEKKNIYFTIEGHVCCTSQSRDAVDRGTGKRNLSHARARYIYDYLARKGVQKKRMKYIGLKHKYPLGGDSKYDRRVEIEITDIRN
ncbi:MAG: OmpA family protein [Flavobacteriaceae bacterium]